MITASNGLEGLRKTKLESPDLLILDVRLPGMDGFEVCHRLRSEPQTVKLPILMLSAKVQENDRNSAADVGANSFISKPVDRSALLSMVEELQKVPESVES